MRLATEINNNFGFCIGVQLKAPIQSFFVISISCHIDSRAMWILHLSPDKKKLFFPFRNCICISSWCVLNSITQILFNLFLKHFIYLRAYCSEFQIISCRCAHKLWQTDDPGQSKRWSTIPLHITHIETPQNCIFPVYLAVNQTRYFLQVNECTQSSTNASFKE